MARTGRGRVVGKRRVGSCDGWAVPWMQGLTCGSQVPGMAVTKANFVLRGIRKEILEEKCLNVEIPFASCSKLKQEVLKE